MPNNQFTVTGEATFQVVVSSDPAVQGAQPFGRVEFNGNIVLLELAVTVTTGNVVPKMRVRVTGPMTDDPATWKTRTLGKFDNPQSFRAVDFSIGSGQGAFLVEMKIMHLGQIAPYKAIGFSHVALEEEYIVTLDPNPKPGPHTLVIGPLGHTTGQKYKMEASHLGGGDDVVDNIKLATINSLADADTPIANWSKNLEEIKFPTLNSVTTDPCIDAVLIYEYKFGAHHIPSVRLRRKKSAQH